MGLSILRCAPVSRKPITGVGLRYMEGRTEILTKGAVGLELPDLLLEQ